jgi:hypothetical protein
MAVTIKTISSEKFQTKFFSSISRYPGMVSAWGTGKTMWALMKVILLSRFYQNNLILIVRSKFTDLRDSTMKDFERYTGLSVPQGTKEARIGSSQILFRHAKELSGLQNVNLGGFLIEQAEEFPTEAQFDLLRGRLRRELVKDPAYKYDKKNPFYDILRRMEENPLRQGMVIANAHGHNWVWKRWIKSPTEGYEGVEATTFDNECNLPVDFVEDLKRMAVDSPVKYSQFVMNDHSEVDVVASYYASYMSQLRKNGHITNVGYDHCTPVFTAWDLGFDCTSIWFYQVVGNEIHIIDYYENTGKPIEHYVDILVGRKQVDKYQYGTFYMPHDANKREMQSGITLSQAIKNMGYTVHTEEREKNIDFGINRVMQTLPRCWFDEKRCELGLEGLDHYRREYDEDRKVYIETPLHDWSSHPADCFRILTKSLTKVTVNNTFTLEKYRELKKKYA